MERRITLWEYRNDLYHKNKKYRRLECKSIIYWWTSLFFQILGWAGVILSGIAGSDKALAGASIAALVLVIMLIAIYFKCKQYNCDRDAYVESHKLSWKQIEDFLGVNRNELKSLSK